MRLGLVGLVYKLGDFFRSLALPEAIEEWTLSRIQTRPINTGGRLVRHAGKLVFKLAEALETREFLIGMMERIGSLRLVPG